MRLFWALPPPGPAAAVGAPELAATRVRTAHPALPDWSTSESWLSGADGRRQAPTGIVPSALDEVSARLAVVPISGRGCSRSARPRCRSSGTARRCSGR
jgi:hypothetical protein